MSEIKITRYSPSQGGGGHGEGNWVEMREDPQGAYVSYQEYEELRELMSILLLIGTGQ